MPKSNPLRQLLTYHDAEQEKRQHKSPCSDCPWRRDSLAGWIGDKSVGGWLHCAHHDGRMECHTRLIGDEPAQCAGAAIYRANVVKSVAPPNLELPANKTKVFGQPLEFAQHHSRGKIATQEQLQGEFARAIGEIIEEHRKSR